MAVYLLEMFGVSLGLTIVIELAVVSLLGVRSKGGLLLALLVNVLTNPPAVLACWLLGIFFPRLPRIAAQIPVECAVVAVEAFLYSCFAKEAQWGIRRPALLAVSANACSWLLGILLTKLF